MRVRGTDPWTQCEPALSFGANQRNACSAKELQTADSGIASVPLVVLWTRVLASLGRHSLGMLVRPVPERRLPQQTPIAHHALGAPCATSSLDLVEALHECQTSLGEHRTGMSPS